MAGLATALTHAVGQERGKVTYHLMAGDLDIPPLAAEIILLALWPVVHERYDIEETRSGLNELDTTHCDAADCA